MKKRIFTIALYVITAIFPFLFLILFVRKISGFSMFALLLNGSFIFFLVLYLIIKLSKKNETKRFLTNYMIFSIGVIIVFCVSYRVQLCIADYIFIKSNEEKLNNFVKEVNEYGKIKSFTDFYGKTVDINRLPDFGNQYYKYKNDSNYLNKIFEKYEIEPQVYYKFRDEINSMGFTRFCKTENEIVYLQRGIDEDMFVLAYSPSGEEPNGVGCYGFSISLQKNVGNWYSPIWF